LYGKSLLEDSIQRQKHYNIRVIRVQNVAGPGDIKCKI